MDPNVGEPVSETNPIVNSANNPSGTAQAESIVPPVSEVPTNSLEEQKNQFEKFVNLDNAPASVVSPTETPVTSPPTETAVNASSITFPEQLNQPVESQPAGSPFPTTVEATPKPEELTPADKLKQKISEDIDDFLAEVTKEPVAA